MANYQLTSIASMVQRLGQRTGGLDTNVFWVQNEKLFAITEAMRFWQALTGQWQERFILALTDTAIMDTPRQLSSVYRISYVIPGVSSTPLNLISLYELDTSFGAWQASTGTPRFWAPCGVNKFALYPHIASADTPNYLELIGYQDIPPQHMGDYINIGNEELTYILDYARHYLAFKEGQGELDATLPGVERMVAAAVQKNSRLAATNVYKRYMGLDHEEGQRPLMDGQIVGVRGIVQ